MLLRLRPLDERNQRPRFDPNAVQHAHMRKPSGKAERVHNGSRHTELARDLRHGQQILKRHIGRVGTKLGTKIFGNRWKICDRL